VGSVKITPANPRAGETIKLEATCLDESGRLVNGYVPARVEVMEPSGKKLFNITSPLETVYTDVTLFVDGTLRFNIPLGTNELVGEWRVKVQELITGKEKITKFTVRPFEDSP
jgi:uncharacterized protein YfaS (alpha-2-macroglobulin family)